MPMNNLRNVPRPVVYVVDDDPAIRGWLQALMRTIQMEVQAFTSAEELLEVLRPDCSGCIISDIRMPGLSGLDLQQRLVAVKIEMPLIYMTGYADVAMAVKAIKQGAFEFLEKPVREQVLLDVVRDALAKDEQTRRGQEKYRAVQERFALLTEREQMVLGLIVEGYPNKNIAHELAISEKTVEVHRARIMAKLEAGSVAQLVQMVLSARISY